MTRCRTRLITLDAEAGQQELGFAEPGAFAAALVGGHGAAFVENFLGPIAGFGSASLGLKEESVVVIGFGNGRDFRGLLEEQFGFFGLAGLSVGVGKQAFAAMKIVVGVGREGAFEVGDGGGEISEGDFGYAAAVEGVGRVGAGGDGFVVGGAGAGEVTVVEIEQAEFFVVAGRGIVEDGAFEFVNAAAARENLE